MRALFEVALQILAESSGEDECLQLVFALGLLVGLLLLDDVSVLIELRLWLNSLVPVMGRSAIIKSGVPCNSLRLLQGQANDVV